jgi:hypothetical protein
MQTLFISQAYIDIALLADVLPAADENTVARDDAASFGGNAVADRFRFARAAPARAIQHLGNEASLPSLSGTNEMHVRFAERRDAVRLMLAG